MKNFRSKLLRAATAAAALAGMIGAVSVQGASADPPTATAYAGVGSDTTQDVVNAFQNVVFNTAKTRTIASWNAVPTNNCFVPKYGAPGIERPTGSGRGITALSDAKTGTAFGVVAGCTGVAIGSGNLDFARSSSRPSASTPNQLTYIPFARDAVMYVWRSNSPTAAADLATLGHAPIASSLNAGGTGHFTSGGTEVYVCLPQLGSGTRSFSRSALGVTNTDANAQAIMNANDPGCGNTVEHDGNAFNTLSNTMLGTRANSAVIIPFSVSQYVAQSNALDDRSNAFRALVPGGTAGIGDIDAIAPQPLVTPACQTACVSNAGYYTFVPVGGTDPGIGTFGREVFNVVATSQLNNVLDPGLKQIFGDPTNPNGVCGTAAQNIVANFGFKPSVIGCGNTSAVVGPFVTGA